MMEIEQTKNKILSYIKDNKVKLAKKIYIAMVVICAIIAIILIDILVSNDAKEKESIKNYSINDISFSESKDEELNKFISNYFRARHTLNYPKIFSSYGRDYYKEIREDKKGDIKKIVDTIRYEKTFVRDYENIKVYTAKGYKNNDVVCVVTYDLLLGFSDGVAPMIIIFYLEKDGESYIINDKLDVGTSKYLMACMSTPEVKSLYNDVKTRLTRNLMSDEGIKLAYNSLRQYEMNFGTELNYEKVNLIENYGLKDIDPVNDADAIIDYIKTKKKEEENEAKLNAYLDKLIASVSEIG